MDDIVSKIMDSDKWPTISLPENLELLNEMANQSFEIKTFSGMLAAAMMYQQIIEAMCLHIIEDCHFQIQLAVYPTKISFKNQPNKMLGFYLDELKSSIEFNKKEQFIEKVENFNVFRNKIVHEMRKSNIDDMAKKLTSSKKLFYEIFDLYDEIQDDFRATFHCFAKDVFSDLVDDEAEE